MRANSPQTVSPQAAGSRAARGCPGRLDPSPRETYSKAKLLACTASLKSGPLSLGCWATGTRQGGGQAGDHALAMGPACRVISLRGASEQR